MKSRSLQVPMQRSSAGRGLVLLLMLMALCCNQRPVFAQQQPAETTSTATSSSPAPLPQPTDAADATSFMNGSSSSNSSNTDDVSNSSSQVNDPDAMTLRPPPLLPKPALTGNMSVDDVRGLVDQMLVKADQADEAGGNDPSSGGGLAQLGGPIAGNFGFTLGDLEDLTTAESPVAGVDGVQSSEAVQDSRNIYKVVNKAKGPTTAASAEAVKGNEMAKVDSAGAFEMYKSLFDQNRWSERMLANITGKECAKDMEVFIGDLRREEPWAMYASDQSGRYRGMYFFGNEYWVGNQMFCNEINRERSAASASDRQHQPELQYFANTFEVTLGKPTIYTKTKTHLQVGQCLPASCSLHDVTDIMRMDPGVQQLNSTTHSNITQLKIRSVPGPYRLWPDARFRLLAGILTVCVLFTIIATICEIRAKRILNSASRHAAEPTAPPTAKDYATNGYAYSISNSNMNNNNLNNNNGQVNGHVNKGFHDTQLELHQIQPASNGNGNATSINMNSNATTIAESRRLRAKELVLSENKKINVLSRFVLSFGLISNSRAILTAKKLSNESVSCIHGMRVLSMLWTIMVHTFLQTFGISENKFARVVKERTFFYQVIGNANYAVDTFFFLSGMLVTLLYLRSNEAYDQKHSKKPSVLSDVRKTVMLFLYRYIRLTPVYFVALLCSETSFKYIYNASVFQPGLDDHSVCPPFWWRNMLYIQNWFPFPQLCMIWSWYLANDMQFYLWAMIVLAIASRYFKLMAAVVVAFLLSSWAISATISLRLNYMLELSEPLISFGFLYDMPWTRIGPYIMGMFGGYLIFRFKEPPRVSRAFNLGMWLLSLVIMNSIIFGVYRGWMTVTETAFYVSLSHTGWGFALIWVTLSCRWGYAPQVNALLSYPAFLPLSRLTYCTYLIHPVTQIVTAFQMQGPFHLQNAMVMTVFLGSAVVSYITAFILCVLCEAPVVRILRIFFNKQ